MNKDYFILGRDNGMLIASLPWSDALAIYGLCPAQHVAYRITAKGKRQVKHLCSNRDANVRENAEALGHLEQIRREKGFGPLPR